MKKRIHARRCDLLAQLRHVKNHEAPVGVSPPWNGNARSMAMPSNNLPQLRHLRKRFPTALVSRPIACTFRKIPPSVKWLGHLAEMVVQDLSYADMADSLNQRGFHTRDGKNWTALAVFKLTPRLIEVAPRILSGGEWESRKRQLSRVAWNS